MTSALYITASKCLDILKLPNVELEQRQNVPYSEGPFMTSPLLHYLKNIKIYDSHSSGNYEDYGILIESIFGIPAGRFVKIETINELEFVITYIVEDIGKIEIKMMENSDYDMRVFEKLGYVQKKVHIFFDIRISEYRNTNNEKVLEQSTIFSENSEMLKCLKNTLDTQFLKYSNSLLIVNPLVHYLNEIKVFDCKIYAPHYIGIMTQNMFGIMTGQIIMIQFLNELESKIICITENINIDENIIDKLKTLLDPKIINKFAHKILHATINIIHTPL
jgi:hypothetical protein